VASLDAALNSAKDVHRGTASFVVALDDVRDIADRMGLAAVDRIVSRAAERLADAVRTGDTVTRLDGARFAVALAPKARGDLESAIQLAARLQGSLTAPFSIDQVSVHVSASVGFAQSQRLSGADGDALLTASERAADEALRNGPGGIRAYSPDIGRSAEARHDIAEGIADALENGQVVAHFQPQLSTDTGQITGFEVLARWSHPERGMIPPAQFLPAVEAAGLSGRLTEVMIVHALTALKAWDRAGCRIDTVAVNFSREDLRDARVVEKIKWELDRFGVPPRRFTAEILETVVAESDDDIVVRNVAALSAEGIGIDLDDFGTGHASIANIRRFAVRRIKIDRSFVLRVDTDPGQQKMLSAILSMADRLGLETLAEGVETHGEHAMLSQLGCTHLQGFAIARPMPFDETIGWIERHRAKLTATPAIGRKTG
jgi:diguanylate cyclase (GGDEF)-like protein